MCNVLAFVMVETVRCVSMNPSSVTTCRKKSLRHLITNSEAGRCECLMMKHEDDE
jgi:hypothetical protein